MKNKNVHSEMCLEAHKGVGSDEGFTCTGNCLDKPRHTSEASHTQTPWNLHDAYICAEDSTFIVDPRDFDNQADAAFIVRAVNCHEELLYVLNNAFEDLNFDGTFEAKDILKTVELVRTKIRQTIAKAEEK